MMPGAFYESVEEFLAAKRSRKAMRRRRRFEKEALRNQQWRLLVRKHFGPKSKIISLLAACAPVDPIPRRKYEASVRIPTVFSIIEQPKEAIDLVARFAARIQRESKIHRIKVDHSSLAKYDLAAEALLDIVAVELKTEQKTKATRKQLRVSGVYPDDPSVKRFIKAAGIVYHMDIPHERPSDAEAEPLRVFSGSNHHYLQSIDPRAADLKDREAAKFIDHVDRCLRDHNRELNGLGKQKLGEYLGEILGNAEEHAGLVDWTVKGYLDNSIETPQCEIAIINFGKSIAESLGAVPKGSYTWNHIDRYLSIHQAHGWFGPKWRKEDLLTVVALQANVSRLNNSAADSRGQGTVDLIEFFQRVHEECNRSGKASDMAILSGSTYIKFDGTYRLQQNAKGVKVIAFNAENSLDLPPDSNYVVSLGASKFPGTIISIRFPLKIDQGSLVEPVDEQSDAGD